MKRSRPFYFALGPSGLDFLDASLAGMLESKKKQGRSQSCVPPRRSLCYVKIDALVKSPTPSLRGAKRRGNLMDIRLITRLLRFARNDKPGVCRLFTISTTLTASQKVIKAVTLARAGVQKYLFFNVNIPMFHHSNIPGFDYSIRFIKKGEGS